jgi:hypothetical protein
VPQPSRMRVYLCATCARRCLVVGAEDQQSQQRCICGGELTPALLSPGQYELIGQGTFAPGEVPTPPTDTPPTDTPPTDPDASKANEPSKPIKQDGVGEA